MKYILIAIFLAFLFWLLESEIKRIVREMKDEGELYIEPDLDVEDIDNLEEKLEELDQRIKKLENKS